MHSEFWMVWREGSPAPVYKHQSEVEARVEAERLAGLNPERAFWVLRAIGFARTRRPQEWVPAHPYKCNCADCIPF